MNSEFDGPLLVLGNGGTLARQVMETAPMLGYAPQLVDEIVPGARDSVPTFIAHEDATARAALIDELVRAGSGPVSLVHPTAFVSPAATLGHNVFIGANCVVAMDAVVGNGVTHNALGTIEHDNQIGDHVFLGTGVILCGRITIGEHSLIGGGATIKPGVSIGRHCTIGTGAVVVKDTEPHKTYVGNPARILG